METRMKPYTYYRCVSSQYDELFTKGRIYRTDRNGLLGSDEGTYGWHGDSARWEEIIEGAVPLDEEEPWGDPVNHPAHYTCFEIEPLTFIMRNGLAFWQGNPIKYICRAGRKLYPGKDAVESEIVDLEKARRMLEMRIQTLKGDKSDCL